MLVKQWGIFAEGKKKAFFPLVLSSITLREKGSNVRASVVKVFVTYSDFNFSDFNLTFFFPPFFFLFNANPPQGGCPDHRAQLAFSFAHWFLSLAFLNKCLFDQSINQSISSNFFLLPPFSGQMGAKNLFWRANRTKGYMRCKLQAAVFSSFSLCSCFRHSVCKRVKFHLGRRQHKFSRYHFEPSAAFHIIFVTCTNSGTF